MTFTFDPTVHSGTPTVNALDNRGLTERETVFHRAKAGDDTDIRISHHQYDLHGNLTQSIDPRPYELMQKNLKFSDINTNTNHK